MKTDRYRFIGLLLIWIFVLSSSYLLRYRQGNSNLIGADAYYNLREIDALRNNEAGAEDTLFFGGRPFALTPFHYIFYYLPAHQIYMKVLPIACGLISLFLLYILLGRLKFRETHRIYTIILFMFSPVFINVFTAFSENFMIITLGLLAVNFLLADNYFVSAALFCIMPLFNLKALVLAVFLLVFVYNRTRGKRTYLQVLSILALTFFIVNATSTFPLLSLVNYLPVVVSDFGSDFGIGIFSLALAAVGLLLSWKNKGEYALLYFMIISAFVLAVHDPFYIMLLESILLYFASLSYSKIDSIRWDIDLLKRYTLLLVFCGLLFSATSYVNRLSRMQPSNEEVRTLQWLSGNSEPGSVVLSHYTNGFIIESFADRPVIVDPLYFSTSQFKNRINDTSTVFSSKDITRVQTILGEYNVSYIWITPEMRHGLVWSKDEQGLLFLLENSEKFKRVYSYQGIEVWKYLK